MNETYILIGVSIFFLGFVLGFKIRSVIPPNIEINYDHKSKLHIVYHYDTKISGYGKTLEDALEMLTESIRDYKKQKGQTWEI